MNHDQYSDGYIRSILNTVKTIAVVGVSANTSRPSYFAFKYLLERGYRMIPVNPGLAGRELLGRRVCGNLAEIPEPVDMVDIFRRSEDTGPIIDEAIAIGAKSIWLQLNIFNEEGTRKAEAAGLKVVVDRCPAIDMPRLGMGPPNPHKPRRAAA